MCLFNGTSQIQCSKKGENKGLYHAHEHAEYENGGWNDPGGQRSQNQKKIMLCHHVAEKPDRKGNRSHEMSDELNDEHQDHKGQRKYGADRTDEMLEIAESVNTDTVHMGCQKNRDRHRSVCVYVAGRREKSGYEAHEIAYNNEKGQGCDQREKMSCPVMADILIAEVEYRADYSFHEILDAAGNKLDRTFNEQCHYNQDYRSQKSI